MTTALKSEKWFDPTKKIDWESGNLVDVFDTLLKAPGPFNGLEITPGDPRTTVSTPIDLNVTVLGYPVDIPIQWSVASGPATVNANGLVTPTGPGTAVVVAQSPAVPGRPLLKDVTTVAIGPGVPLPPTAVTAWPRAFVADVTWVAPASDRGSALTGYVVTTVPPTTSNRLPPSATSATIPGLTAGERYRIQVFAQNAVGSSLAGVSPEVTPTDGSFQPITGPATNITAGDPRVYGLSAQQQLRGATGSDYLVRKDLVSGAITLVSREIDHVTPVPAIQGSLDFTGNLVTYHIIENQQTQKVLFENLTTTTVTEAVTGTVGDQAWSTKLSADGTALALMTADQSTSPWRYAVYRIALATNAQTKISKCWVAYACQVGAGGDVLDISANGRYVLFEDEVPDALGNFPLKSFLYDASTGAATELHKAQTAPGFLDIQVTSISPDATAIAGWSYLDSTHVGPFIQHSLTAPLAATDLLYDDYLAGSSVSPRQLSTGGQVSAAFLVGGRIQIWAYGGLAEIAGPTSDQGRTGGRRCWSYPSTWVSMPQPKRPRWRRSAPPSPRTRRIPSRRDSPPRSPAAPHSAGTSPRRSTGPI